MSSAEEPRQDLPNGSSGWPTIGFLRGTARPRSERSLSPLLDELGGYVQPEPEDDDWAGEEVPAGAETAAGEAVEERAFRKRLETFNLGDVAIGPPEWIWPGWLARGKLHLLVGRQGTGKSTLAAWLIARVTRGEPLPGSEEACPPLRAGCISLEEGRDGVAARLVAAGADPERVVGLDEVVEVIAGAGENRRPWRLRRDLEALEDAIEEHGLDLVVLDGIGHGLGGDGNSYQEVGEALARLAMVTDRTRAAILGLTHPAKGRSEAVVSAIGSTGWTAIPRLVWVLGLDAANESQDRRVLAVGKTNYRPPPHALSFLISEHPELEVGVAGDFAPSSARPDEITAPPLPEEREARTEARDFLHELLAAGPVSAKVVEAQAKAAGIARRTLRRAAADLGVEHVKSGMDAGWSWVLPEGGQPSPEGGQPSSVDIFGARGHLRRELGVYSEDQAPLSQEDGQASEGGHLRRDLGKHPENGARSAEGVHPSASGHLREPWTPSQPETAAADDAPTCRLCRERLLVSESRAAGLCYRCRRAAQVPTADDDWLEPF